MKSIFKNVVTITSFTLVTRFLGFFFHIFLSRAIGAEALGLYQVASSVFMVLLTIVSSGFTLIISRMTASYRISANKKAVGTLVSSCFIVGLLVSVLLCVVVLLCRNLFSNLFTDANCINIVIILLPSLVFSSIYSVFRGAMWGNDNYFGLCASELLEEVVKIVVCVLLLGSGMTALQSAMSVAWSFTTSCVVSAVFVVLLYFFYGGKLNKPSKIYRKVLRQSAPITGVRVASSFVQPLIALILPAQLVAAGYTNPQAMSLYGIAVGMTLPFLYVPSALIGSLSTALVPDISMAMVKNDTQHIQKRISSALTFALAVSFVLVPTFTAIGDKLGVFLYAQPLAGTLLQHCAWVMVPMGLAGISSAILNSVGLEVRAFVNYMCGEAFMFLAVLALPRVLGISALIVGLGASAVVSALLNLWTLKRKLRVRLGIWKGLLKMTAISVPTMALTSFVSSLLAIGAVPLFFDIAISCVVGVGCFALLGMVFGVVNFSACFVQFKEKFRGKKTKKA